MTPSPGRYHEFVPREPAANVRFRLALLGEAEKSPAVRAGLVELCRRDVLFYINAFVWQYNPLKVGHETGPFITWHFQDEAVGKILAAMEEQRSILVEKSREMGGTYLCLIVLGWLAKFHDAKKCLVVSRSQEAVDQAGDPDCIFWKLDEINRHEPDWLIGPVRRKKNLFAFERTGSVISGTASTGKAGVGGRASAILVDEFSQITEAREVRNRTASTSRFRIFTGTHVGMHSEFFNMAREPEIEKVVMHWTQHPDKVGGLYAYDQDRPTVPKILDPSYHFPPDYQFVLDGTPAGGPRPGVRSPWYDKMCVEIGGKGGRRAIAEDLDINPEGTVAQVFDPLAVNNLIHRHCRDPFWRGDVRVEPATAEVVEFVARHDGPLKLWLTPMVDTRVPASTYVFGSDLAWGTGATPSCLAAVDGRTGIKVLELADPFASPEEFALTTVGLCKWFADENGTPAMLAWESQGPGLKFGLAVLKTGFRRIHYHRDDFDRMKAVSPKPGWMPSPDMKDKLVLDYQSALDAGRFLNYSEVALKECLQFVWDAGHIKHPGEFLTDDPSGARIGHGDRVVADALACKMASGVSRLMAEAPPEVPFNSFLYRRNLRLAARGDLEPLEAI